MLIIGLLLLLFLLITIFMPWFQRSSINALREEVEQLRRRIRYLEDKDYLEKRAVAQAEEKEKPAPASISHTEIRPPVSLQEARYEDFPTEQFPAQDFRAEESRAETSPTEEFPSEEFGASEADQKAPGSSSGFSFEQSLGAKLPVWIGGISLALAGFFMVKYSIENNLVSPSVRLALSFIFGLGLLGAGKYLSLRPQIADAGRICQSLTGAGLVCLYGVFFAAGNLYDLLPPGVCFAGMVAVTVTAVLLSISQGPAVAVFGMIGGFLTPILVDSDKPNTILLTIYLSALSYGLLFLARRQNWTWLVAPVYGLSLLWAAILVFAGWSQADSIWICLYLIGLVLIGPYILFSRYAAFENQEGGKQGRVSLAGSIVAMLLLSVIVSKADFTTQHWIMFGLAGLASMALAVFRPAFFAPAPAICGLVTAFLLFSWTPANFREFLPVAFTLIGVYFMAGLLFMLRAPDPRWWSKIALLSLPVLYVVSYVKYAGQTAEGNSVWQWAALAISAVSVGLVTAIQRHIPDWDEYKGKLMALGGVLGLGFLSWGLFLALETRYLMIAYALQIIGVAWLMQRFQMTVTRLSLQIAAALFITSLLPYGTQICSLIAVRDFDLSLRGDDNFPLLPLIATVPLLGWAGRMDIHELWRRIFTGSACAIALCVVFAALHKLLEGNAVLNEYGVRALTLNLVWAIIIGGMLLIRRAHLDVMPGIILGALGYAVFQTAAIDLLMHFPGHDTHVGDTKILNLLIPAFGLPAFYMAFTTRHAINSGLNDAAKALTLVSLAYALLFVTLEVAQFYQGGYMFRGERSLGEIYTYSVVWLLTGLAALCVGTVRRNKMLRLASLFVIAGTVCKVFLYDASALDGLLRVLSFLGLGVSLIGLSYFYTRFIAPHNK